MICKPTGMPSFLEKPAGSDIAGNPAMLTGMVKASFMYIFVGSVILSPNGKAVEASVAPIMTS